METFIAITAIEKKNDKYFKTSEFLTVRFNIYTKDFCWLYYYNLYVVILYNENGWLINKRRKLGRESRDDVGKWKKNSTKEKEQNEAQ